MRRGLIALVVVIAVFLAPWSALRVTARLHTPQDAPPVEAALIFGALVRSGQISPLHRERLDAGRVMLEAGTADMLVVSNAAKAARAMEDYLLARGVAPERIERDGSADSTPDTCANEAARAAPRKVAFVSNAFHLPRIRLHCAPYALDAVLVVADDPGRATAPFLTRLRVRSYRFLRENLLTWAVLLRVYPTG